MKPVQVGVVPSAPLFFLPQPSSSDMSINFGSLFSSAASSSLVPQFSLGGVSASVLDGESRSGFPPLSPSSSLPRHLLLPTRRSRLLSNQMLTFVPNPIPLTSRRQVQGFLAREGESRPAPTQAHGSNVLTPSSRLSLASYHVSSRSRTSSRPPSPSSELVSHLAPLCCDGCQTRQGNSRSHPSVIPSPPPHLFSAFRFSSTRGPEGWSQGFRRYRALLGQVLRYLRRRRNHRLRNHPRLCHPP